MRRLLANQTNNIPREVSAFARTEDPATCARCTFRRPCGHEAAVKVA